MGIYFRDILLISISRGANNCGQHALEKNIYFIMRFSPHLQLFYFSDRLEFCEFFEWKIKRINNADLFSQTPFLTFIKGANISGGHCKYVILFNIIILNIIWYTFIILLILNLLTAKSKSLWRKDIFGSCDKGIKQEMIIERTPVDPHDYVLRSVIFFKNIFNIYWPFFWHGRVSWNVKWSKMLK